MPSEATRDAEANNRTAHRAMMVMAHRRRASSRSRRVFSSRSRVSHTEDTAIVDERDGLQDLFKGTGFLCEGPDYSSRALASFSKVESTLRAERRANT